MGTARDFHVKTGLVVDGGNVTLSNGNLLVNSGHIDIDNIKIDGQTISTITGDEDINITPHGTGSVVISKSTLTTTDINAGTIDGVTIATSDITVGTDKTLDVSGGTLTLADDQISGDAISGGTIGSITISALAGALSLGDNNITNVGDLNADSISVDDAAVGLDIVFGGNTTLNKISLTDNLADALNITETSNSYMKFTTTNGADEAASGLITFGKDTTFASTNIHDLGTVTTADIDGGSIDGTIIGANSAVAGTFSTLIAVTVDAATDFTVGSTVITDDVITFTPSTSDTVTLTAAANAAFTIATIDGGGEGGHINLQADGNVNLKFTSATKLTTKSTGVDVFGHLEGSTSIHSAHARMRASDGIEDNAGYGSAGTHPVLDVDGTNFYTSETLAVTEVANKSKVPGGAYGTNGTDVGNVTILSLNVENASYDTFQAVEAFCALSIKKGSSAGATAGNLEYRVVNKVYGVFNKQGGIDTIVQFESGDVNLGHFHWVLGGGGFGSNADSMSLVFKYTSKITHDSNAETTYSINCNGLSLSGAGG